MNDKPRDELLERYADAVAQDPRRPSDRVRHAARAHAQMLRDEAAAVTRLETAAPRKPAANQSQWTLSLVASLAVVGLAGLLYVQIDRGAPEVREAALGTSVPNGAPAAQTATPPTAAADPATAARADGAPTEQTRPHGNAKTVVARAATADPATQSVAVTPHKELPPSPPVPAQVPVAEQALARAPAAKATTLPAAEADMLAASGAMGDAKRNANSAESAQRAAPAAMAPIAPTPAPAPAAATALAAAKPLDTPRRARDVAVGAATVSFFEAARTGNTESLQKLLIQGAAVNARDDKGNTALMLAVRHHQTLAARKLLEWGADVSLVNDEGLTALQLANQIGMADMVQLLQAAREPLRPVP